MVNRVVSDDEMTGQTLDGIVVIAAPSADAARSQIPEPVAHRGAISAALVKFQAVQSGVLDGAVAYRAIAGGPNNDRPGHIGGRLQAAADGQFLPESVTLMKRRNLRKG